MATSSVGANIDRARESAGLSQRALADRTGIPQATLSRIIAGERVAKMPEIIRLADATGYTVGYLAGEGDLSERVRLVARATNGSAMAAMRQQLLHYLELDAYLDDQGIVAPR